MTSKTLAISRLGENDSRETQTARAVKWLMEQPGGPIVVVTPRREVSNEILKRLVARTGVRHLTGRDFTAGPFAGQRVLYAWPDRESLNDVWGAEADALVVVEWDEDTTAEWIEDAGPLELFPGEIREAKPKPVSTSPALSADVEGILEYVAGMAAGYSSGLKWNEEDKLKADMMHRPERWESVTVEQVRAKCRELGMRPRDVDTISGYLHRRKDGKRFNVRSSYRDFQFN